MDRPRRKSLRLEGWDYSLAARYHLVACTDGRRPLFGAIVDANGVPISRATDVETLELHDCRMSLNDFGKICEESLLEAAASSKAVSLQAFCVMPNHVHLLVALADASEQPKALATFVSGFKARTSREIRKLQPSAAVWQRGYYDHLIRNDEDLARTVSYIEENPVRWVYDRYFV